MNARVAPAIQFTLLLFAAMLLAACGGGDSDTNDPSARPSPGEMSSDTPDPEDRKVVVIGFVAKSQSNAVFTVAEAGARDAAKELGEEYGVEIDLRIETPPDEDAQAQAQAIAKLASIGAEGIAVSASDAGTLRKAIKDAVANGSNVVCFDSDVPDSGRMCFYGTDDADCGQKVMESLAEVMEGQGNIAILAGNQAAPNLQKRRDGVMDELTKHTEMKLVNTYYHVEDPASAAQKINEAQSTAKPTIEGWALIGGWPLFTTNALRWEPGEVKVVSVDALPDMLPYVDSGHVQVLWAQNCYGWGYESVRLLLEKIVNDKAPEEERVIAPLTKVTRENADAYRAQFKAWMGK